MADAVQPQRDRNLTRHHADNRNGNRVRCDLSTLLDKEVVVLLLADVDPPAAAADDDAGIRLRQRQTGVEPGLTRGDDADERGSGIAFGIGAVPGVSSFLTW